MSILCFLLVLMIMFYMAEKHWYKWTISVFQSCKSCTHDGNVHCKAHYWIEQLYCIYWCWWIGVSVELGTLTQQLVHLNQPTYAIQVWIYTILLGAGAADSSLCLLLFTDSYADLVGIVDSSNQSLSFTAGNAVFAMLNIILFSILVLL